MIMQCPVKIFIGCAKADFGGRNIFSNIALLLIGAKQGALIVSPNPVTDKINLPGVGLQRSPIYTLYNLKGQLLQKGNLTNRSVLLEPGLVNAVYHLRIFADGTTLTANFYKN